MSCIIRHPLWEERWRRGEVDRLLSNTIWSTHSTTAIGTSIPGRPSVFPYCPTCSKFVDGEGEGRGQPRLLMRYSTVSCPADTRKGVEIKRSFCHSNLTLDLKPSFPDELFQRLTWPAMNDHPSAVPSTEQCLSLPAPFPISLSICSLHICPPTEALTRSRGCNQ